MSAALQQNPATSKVRLPSRHLSPALCPAWHTPATPDGKQTAPHHGSEKQGGLLG
ncbi:hypothetical protein [Acetobacter sp. LMG 32666]|uniref:hypothetical protein n=1 Tax=Acetobacter sp. LMG 32666 TaxID=2959295 RepID=UPI0030C87DBB